MKADLVCKSGGIRGIALVGALSYLEESGYEWQRVAGCSAGSIVAALVAVGYTAREIKSIMEEIDYTKFKDRNTVQSIPIIGEMISMLVSKGLYAGDYFEKFLEEKLKAKGKTKFKDVFSQGEYKLKVVTTDVTRQELCILPDDLVKYGIDPMEFEIAKAVRMSISIPFFYTPVKLGYNNRVSYMVDGGLLSKFPIWIFDVSGVPRWPTFGLSLMEYPKENTAIHSNLISYMLDVIQTSLNTSEEVYFKERDSMRIIDIKTNNISSIDFNITKEELNALYESGYTASKKFLQNWDFEEYKRKCRCNTE